MNPTGWQSAQGPGRVLGLLLLLFLTAVSAPSLASGAVIENPGPVEVEVTSGFVKLGTRAPQELDTSNGGYGISGSVSPDGAFSAPPSGFNFKPVNMVVSGSFGTFVYRVDLIATQALSGAVDPIAGTLRIELRFKAKITLTQGGALGDVGNACFVGTDQAPIVVVLTTTASASPSVDPEVSKGGREYRSADGTARVADTTFTAPGQSGCSGLAGGSMNGQIGLPAASGVSAAEFDIVARPAPKSPPGIAIVTGPSDPTDSRNAGFTFKSNLPDGFTFECRLDQGEWAPCQETAGFAELELGPHVFAVRSTGPDGEAGPESSYDWNIVGSLRRVRPRLEASPGTAGTRQPVSLDASSSEIDLGVKLCDGISSGPCGYRWDIDGDGAIDETTDEPVLETTYFAPGMYRPRVTIIDVNGNSGTAETWLEVQSTPSVSIVGGPPGVSVKREAVFTFELRSGPELSRTECKLDGGEFRSCVSGSLTRVAQAAGTRAEHRFEVRAITPRGVVGPAALHRWTIDLTAQQQPPLSPSTTVATFNGKRLTFEVKCANRFSPRCLYREVAAVNGRGRKAKPISSRAKARAEAGRTRVVSINVKPQFRKKVRSLAGTGKRTLIVRAQILYKRNGKPERRRVLNSYRVTLTE